MTGGADLLEAGDLDGEDGGWLSGRRRLAAAVLAVALVGGVVAWQSRPHQPPEVQVSMVTASSSVLLGQGTGAVLRQELRVAVSGGRPGPGAPQVDVLGVTGPGVLDRSSLASDPRVARSAPVLADGGRSLVDVRLLVDCGHLPLPVTAGAFDVRLQVLDRGRRTTRQVALRRAGTLTGSLERECQPYEAERRLQVTAVTGTVDPHRPSARLELQVTNRGPTGARVTVTPGPDVAVSPASVRVPAGGLATFSVHLSLGRCPTWPPRAPSSTARTPVPLAAVFDHVPAAVTAPGDPGPYAGLTPAAGQQLVDLLGRACAGVTSPLALTLPSAGNVRYDARTRLLTATVAIYFPPGWVGTAVVRPAREPGDPVARWTATGPQAPDRSGLLQVPGRRWFVPVGTSCGEGEPLLPLDVRVRQESGAEHRTARFRLYAETYLLPSQRVEACRG